MRQQGEMAMILLKLLGIGRWLKQAATALLGLIRRYPWQAALIAALCLAGWQYSGKQNALADLAAERLAHAETIKAGEQAYAAQVALNKAAEAKSAAIAKETDDAHEKQLALANDRTERWITANRVHKDCASRTSATSSGAEGPVAESGDATSGQAELVAVPAADVRICTVNTLRLEAVRDWGIALKDAGLAE